MSPHRLVREAPGPIPSKSSKKRAGSLQNPKRVREVFPGMSRKDISSAKLVSGQRAGEPRALYCQGGVWWGTGKVLLWEALGSKS